MTDIMKCMWIRVGIVLFITEFTQSLHHLHQPWVQRLHRWSSMLFTARRICITLSYGVCPSVCRTGVLCRNNIQLIIKQLALDCSLGLCLRTANMHGPYIFRDPHPFGALHRRGAFKSRDVTQVCAWLCLINRVRQRQKFSMKLIRTYICPTHRYTISDDLERPLILISHDIERRAVSPRQLSFLFSYLVAFGSILFHHFLSLPFQT